MFFATGDKEFQQHIAFMRKVDLLKYLKRRYRHIANRWIVTKNFII